MKRTAVDHFFSGVQLVVLCYIFSMLGMTCHAQSVCAPRAGTWTFAAGTVCYGDGQR